MYWLRLGAVVARTLTILVEKAERVANRTTATKSGTVRGFKPGEILLDRI